MTTTKNLPTWHQPTETRGAPIGEGWTDERVDRLKKLWKDGLPVGVIAEVLGGGATRNSVVSKAHRLKLPGRPPAIKRTYTRKGEPRQPREKPRLEVVVSRNPVNIMDLNKHTCRYPIGDPREEGFGYCGVQVQEGSSYCPEHHARCYTRPEK